MSIFRKDQHLRSKTTAALILSIFALVFIVGGPSILANQEPPYIDICLEGIIDDCQVCEPDTMPLNERFWTAMERINFLIDVSEDIEEQVELYFCGGYILNQVGSYFSSQQYLQRGYQQTLWTDVDALIILAYNDFLMFGSPMTAMMYLNAALMYLGEARLDMFDFAAGQSLTLQMFAERKPGMEQRMYTCLGAKEYPTCTAEFWLTAQIYGCTDSSANNHVSEANIDDGSCEYDQDEEEEYTPPRQGGGGITLTKDNCPDGDFSPSYYDGVCHKEHQSANDPSSDNNTQDHTSIREILGYLATFDPQTPLIRKYAAQITTLFATQILGREPNLNKACVFSDIANEDPILQSYIISSCQLEIMGMEPDGKTPKPVFDPNDLVDRRQLGTILSRLIYDGAVTGTPGCWYCNHLIALQQDGIMTRIDIPTLQETMGYLTTILFRAYQLLQK